MLGVKLVIIFGLIETGITPKKVQNYLLLISFRVLYDFERSLNHIYFLNLSQILTDSSVHTKKLFIHDCSQG